LYSPQHRNRLILGTAVILLYLSYYVLAKPSRLPPYSIPDPRRPLPSLHRLELDLLLDDRLRREGRRAIPACKRLERLLCLPLVLASGMIPEQVIRILPAARLEGLEERFPFITRGALKSWKIALLQI
jgi:hypothetical protein